MTPEPEQLEEWKHKELPPFSIKNIYPEYIYEATKFIKPTKQDFNRLCKCSVCSDKSSVTTSGQNAK